MYDRTRAARLLRSVVRLAVPLLLAACGDAVLVGQRDETPAVVRPWPCRLVVGPTLLAVVQQGWERSPTLQRQCRELARAGAVVILEWGRTETQAEAATKMRTAGGVVVAHVSVPPASDALVLVVHELEHVLERVRGVDFAAESKRRGSGVWQAYGGFETQRAIDAGARVRRELRSVLTGEAIVGATTPAYPGDALVEMRCQR